MKSSKKESSRDSFRVWKTLIRGSICMINSPKWNSLLANDIPQIGLEPENYRLLPWYGRAASSREEGAAGLSKLAALPNEIEILSLSPSLSSKRNCIFPLFFARYTHVGNHTEPEQLRHLHNNKLPRSQSTVVHYVRGREEKRCVDGGSQLLRKL